MWIKMSMEPFSRIDYEKVGKVTTAVTDRLVFPLIVAFAIVWYNSSGEEAKQMVAANTRLTSIETKLSVADIYPRAEAQATNSLQNRRMDQIDRRLSDIDITLAGMPRRRD